MIMPEVKKDLSTFIEDVYNKDQLAFLISELEVAKSNIYKNEQNITLSKKIQSKVSEKFINKLYKLEQSGLFPGSSKLQTEYLDNLKKCLLSLPVCKITISFEPSLDFQRKLSEWFEEKIGRKVILDILVVDKIVAGAQIEYEGTYRDYSISSLIDQLIKELNLGGVNR